MLENSKETVSSQTAYEEFFEEAKDLSISQETRTFKDAILANVYTIPQILELNTEQALEILLQKIQEKTLNTHTSFKPEISTVLSHALQENLSAFKKKEINQNTLEQTISRLQYIAANTGIQNHEIYRIPTQIIDLEEENNEFQLRDKTKKGIYPRLKEKEKPENSHEFFAKITLDENKKLQIRLFRGDIPQNDSTYIKALFDFDTIYIELPEGELRNQLQGKKMLGRPIKIEERKTPYRAPYKNLQEETQWFENQINTGSNKELQDYITSAANNENVYHEDIIFIEPQSDVNLRTKKIAEELDVPLAHCALAPALLLKKLEENNITDGKIVNIAWKESRVIYMKAGAIDSFADHWVLIQDGRVYDPYVERQGLPLQEYLDTFLSNQENLRFKIRGNTRGNEL